MKGFIGKYFGNLGTLLKDNAYLYFLISGFLLFFVTIYIAIIYVVQSWYFFFLGAFIVLFLLTLAIQHILLMKKCYTLYIVRLILLVFIVTQAFGMIMSKQGVSTKSGNFMDSYEYDKLMGFKSRPNMDTYHTLTLGEDTIFNAHYVTDSLGRRIAADADYVKTDSLLKPHKHALFFGCSFTFGEGLDYFSTFPYLFEKHNPDYQSYNYGLRGGGPHQFALLFDNGINVINKNTIKEPEGIAVYTFINDHLSRVFATTGYLQWAGNNIPDVCVENDSLVVKRVSGKKIFFSRVLNFVYLFKYMKLSTHYPQTDEFYKRFADIINYTAKKYKEVCPDGAFYVTAYPFPDDGIDLGWVKFLSPDIKFVEVEVPADLEQNRDKYRIPHDNHPTETMNEFFIEKITPEIK
ncbi:MAG: hypothetical protein LBR13_06865 [Dysgonamonadaceae bacterium]|jgi:hypothetical protein|nr:hypothetical protein [Dysgonamonadaceae bacterium]